jgi:hypothetical protein
MIVPHFLIFVRIVSIIVTDGIITSILLHFIIEEGDIRAGNKRYFQKNLDIPGSVKILI